ncbi:hypothetical protein [Sphingomonas sp. TREG-RG-20F-R18-01]|uniref:hypothetical protein n=1 Tax=Sphingomonas sp. TREG-RG-20F-R18-01 TaxID=2914982 RepID=UPI001F57D427|nr:hypothetical protein [Sphingomonas sp. TREG-RG-20F-R18-01]
MPGPSRFTCGVVFGLACAIVSAARADTANGAVSAELAPHAVAPGAGSRAMRVLSLPSRATVVAMTPLPTRVTGSDSASDPGARGPDGFYDLRLAQSDAPNKLARIKRNLQLRGTGMRDAYLHGDHGLRMSVGSSYHMQYRAAEQGPGAAAGSGALMRLPVGAVNLRNGYEGYAPVAMAGYDTFVSDRMKVGIEGGMMIGRSTAMYADETVPGTGDGSRVGRNPVADVVMTYAF